VACMHDGSLLSAVAMFEIVGNDRQQRAGHLLHLPVASTSAPPLPGSGKPIGCRSFALGRGAPS
jgi:hypothetical protein